MGDFPDKGVEPQELLGHLPEEQREVAQALRALYLREPPEATQARHLATIAKAAAEATGEQAVPAPSAGDRRATRRRRRGSFRPLARPLAAAAAAALAVPLSLVGLAFAGVGLPQAAQSVFEDIGLDLPNQDGREHGKGNEVTEKVRSTPPKERDCEFGQGVAETARGEHAGARHDPCARPGATNRGGDGGSKGGQAGEEPGSKSRGIGEETSGSGGPPKALPDPAKGPAEGLPSPSGEGPAGTPGEKPAEQGQARREEASQQPDGRAPSCTPPTEPCP